MKKIKGLLLISCLLSATCLMNCEESDVSGQCAGCDADTPWSVFGSKECYPTIDDCEVAEKGDCVICT